MVLVEDARRSDASDGLPEIISIRMHRPDDLSAGEQPSILRSCGEILRGFVVHDLCYEPTAGHQTEACLEFLQEKTAAISDTCATMHLHDCLAVISTEDLDHLPTCCVQASPAFV